MGDIRMARILTQRSPEQKQPLMHAHRRERVARCGISAYRIGLRESLVEIENSGGGIRKHPVAAQDPNLASDF